MAKDGPLQVIVVDDVVRFALHVWRYLGRSLGFGIGAVPSDEAGRFREGEELSPLRTADGRAEVWWVQADSGVVEDLEKVENARPGSRRLYLIDVKAPEGTYLKKILAWRRGREGGQSDDETIRFVSSYAEQIDYPVWPKSPATLEWVRSQVTSRSRSVKRDTDVSIGESGYLDVLVTGAGFERCPPAWKGEGETAEHDLGFGLPATGQILRGMRDPFEAAAGSPASDPKEDKVYLAEGPGKFPEPCGRFLAEAELSPLKTVAEEGLLDEWWDQLLEAELRGRLHAESAALERERVKGEAWIFEARMREAFRRAILRHDWGHLGQALIAARLPWAAWLTTNYTRFADRAIDLASDGVRRESEDRNRSQGGASVVEESKPSKRLPEWRVVATAQEAQLLIRELQGRRDRKPWPLGRRPLFKLHGDISHLQTMAIAGHDKELFSVLSVRVDYLYQVYDAAEKYLLRLVQKHSGHTVRFHVVGHGLKDRSLVNVLSEVARGARKKPELRIVSRDEVKVPGELSHMRRPRDQKEGDAESYMESLWLGYGME